MSFQDVVARDFDTTAANSQFSDGLTVLQRPLGVVANEVEVSGCLFQRETATKSTTYGEQTERRATLFVPRGTTVDPRDKWIINGVEWQCTHAGEQSHLNMQEVSLQRNDKQTIKGRRGPTL